MKSSKWFLLAGMVIMLMSIGCQDQMGFVDKPQGGDVKAAVLPPLMHPWGGSNWFLYFHYSPPDAAVYPMSIGQDNGATGSYVKVWKDVANNKLVVVYQTLGDWYISQTHVAVALTHDGLPHKNNGLIPGKFPYHATLNIPYPQVCTMRIAWKSEWDVTPPDSLFMAALCNVAEGTNVGGVWTYTIWNTGCAGEGDGYKDVNLPTVPVKARMWHPNGDISYWLVELGDVPLGYSVWNGMWNGWCAEFTVGGVYQGEWYDVTLWSTLNPSLPSRFANAGWDNVNYLLNHKLDGATMWEINAVIWHLLGQTSHPLDGLAKQMADEAELYGDGWRPKTGEWIAVILETPTAVQLCFIEVDP